MSVWNQVEWMLIGEAVLVEVNAAEQAVLRESLADLIKEQLSEDVSAWHVFEQFVENAALQLPVKGISDNEAETLKSVPAGRGIQMRRGNTGMVAMLDPHTWAMVKKQLEMQKGGLKPAEDLVQKISDALRSIQGRTPARSVSSPNLGGKANDVTPAATGARQFGMSGPGGLGWDDLKNEAAPAGDAGDVAGGVLNKKTHQSKSITLTQAEFENLMTGQYTVVNITSMTGKPIKKVPSNYLVGQVKRGRARMLLAQDNPDNPNYWVINI